MARAARRTGSLQETPGFGRGSFFRLLLKFSPCPRAFDQMSIAVCMVVKNEAQRIVDCLESVLPQVDEVIVIDTGSTDGTPELLKSRFGIEVQHGRLQEERCLTVADLRNHAVMLRRILLLSRPGTWAARIRSMRCAATWC